MLRSSDNSSKPIHGWETTSHDYHAHMSRMERMPSLLTGVPHYPDVHRAFNHKAPEEEVIQQQKHHHPSKVTFQDQVTQQQSRSPKANEKVEYKQVECDKNGSCKTVYQESIDVEADGYIQQKHRGFELCKWKTFRVN